MRWKLVCASSFRSPCSPRRLVEKPWKGIRLLSKPLSSVIPSSPLDWIDACGRLVSLLRKYLWTGGDAEFGGSSAARRWVEAILQAHSDFEERFTVYLECACVTLPNSFPTRCLAREFISALSFRTPSSDCRTGLFILAFIDNWHHCISDSCRTSWV